MSRKTPLIVSLLLATALTAGCVDNFGAFYISQALPPGTGCTVPAPASSGIFLANGVLDVSLKRGYRMYAQVENHMVSGAGGGKVETNMVSIREFKVELDLSEIPGSYPESMTKFSERAAGTLNPGGLLVASVEVIPDALAAMLAGVVPNTLKPTIVANLRAVGNKSGSTMETPAYPFPVKVCSGCLVDMRTTCPTTKDTYFSNTCGVPQDSPVTCCPAPTGSTGTVCMKTGTTTGS